MPLTEKGKEIKAEMEKEYGEKKGTEVFYASANKGTIKGVHNAAPAVMPGPPSPPMTPPRDEVFGVSLPGQMTASEMNARNRQFWERQAPTSATRVVGEK